MKNKKFFFVSLLNQTLRIPFVKKPPAIMLPFCFHTMPRSVHRSYIKCCRQHLAHYFSNWHLIVDSMNVYVSEGNLLHFTTVRLLVVWFIGTIFSLYFDSYNSGQGLIKDFWFYFSTKRLCSLILCFITAFYLMIIKITTCYKMISQ